MHVPLSYYLDMCQKLSGHMLFFNNLHLSARETPVTKHPPTKETIDPVEEPDSWNSPETAYDAWLASREIPGQNGTYLVAGAQRPLSLPNARLAFSATIHKCAFSFFKELWALNPVRTTLMMSLNIIRSLFPAFRGYSQAMIIDELQSLIASGSFTWYRLTYLITTELVRRVFEGLLDSFAFSNENIVLESARFFVEREQLKHRVRLDVPTLADPIVRDLLQEADLFARSFNGGGFGVLSPFDFIHILSLTIEIISHIAVVISLTRGATHLGVLLLSISSAMLPLVLPWCNFSQTQTEPSPSIREARAVERHERMRSLAYSEVHRPEIALFGLGDWILETWSNARKIVLTSEQPHLLRESSFLSQLHLSDLLFALQNIPLVWLMQTSSASLGSLTLYRSSVQSVVFACGNLIRTTRMAFQGIFLMSAFCASKTLKPRLQPDNGEMAKYDSLPGGVSIEVRGLSYTYPGSSEPALKNVHFTLAPGESLAIVGFNGSGKSTLAKILLRIVDFDEGTLKVNGVDVRRYHPDEYHRHLTAVFQGFSKFNATVQENVGLGYVEKVAEDAAVEHAVHLAQADGVVAALPYGLGTTLETRGFESISYPGINYRRHAPHHGLSGGEWQRIAIARAFMRASQPEVDLLLFDEPTSSLDAHAQNQIFDTIQKISTSPFGKKTKSVIFITHRLSTARRADKVAMMENGTISEFGTHQELLSRNGSYAALYRASM
ncbi:putative P-loop containing nucleoside triphosphate hydrolase protein [Lyophyllum shimeji]|uniref:P-loop containing nucleoside triphosphate hydrolase protein n=1 Tax=Lyophyllum shimeji TaxID=47721 RepID=A0A9P3UH98_LYOSH|nr:putative P-loop containing nucleoside triphosphate hydrolase protein [Lyophyllum shimeji]